MKLECNTYTTGIKGETKGAPDDLAPIACITDIVSEKGRNEEAADSKTGGDKSGTIGLYGGGDSWSAEDPAYAS